MTAEHRVYGPPGTGKTTYLSNQAKRAAEKHGAKNVVVASLTRTAAEEVAGRHTGIPSRNVSTLHAHAFRALDHPAVADVPEGFADWNRYIGAGPLQIRNDLTAELDGPPAEAYGYASDGEILLAEYGVARNRMLPRELWRSRLREFADRWEEWKRETGRMDFTDLIEVALRTVPELPGEPAVFMLDEAQDLSKLEMALARQWGEKTDHFVVVGDPDQCQPAGTMVETSAGPVPIEELSPGCHRLLSFDRRGSNLLGRRKGFEFEITSRSYSGELIRVSAGGRSTECTHDHRWAVRWAPGHGDACVVYLMERDGMPRVGWCKLHGSGSSHLATRGRLDGVDRVWVLASFVDRRAASIYETEVATRFGLPLPTFRERDMYENLEPHRELLRCRAEECLVAHHRDPRQPLLDYAERHTKRGRRTSWVVRACNLMPGLMMIPVPRRDGRICDWEPVSVDRRSVRDERVWSMNVEPHHTYVADGVVTMNNLYEWRGSDPGAFAAAEAASEHILSQSYRVPRAVHEYAVSWIERIETREPVKYDPRDEDGDVQLLRHSWTRPDALVQQAVADVAEGKSVMFLASCTFMLEPLVRVLRTQGVPFHNPYRTKNGAWNPMRSAYRVLSYLAPSLGGDADLRAKLSESLGSGLWTWGQMKAWVDPLLAKGVTTRGAKSLIEGECQKDRFGDSREDEVPPLEETLALFESEHHDALRSYDLIWWESKLRTKRKHTYAYALEVVRRYGVGALSAEPNIIIGTIHSVKGGESDRVYVFPDISRRAAEEARRPGGREAAIRQFYVAFTRAREGLYICRPDAEHYLVLPEP